MKFSVHMNMFWQHYLENKKLIFLACIPEFTFPGFLKFSWHGQALSGEKCNRMRPHTRKTV